MLYPIYRALTRAGRPFLERMTFTRLKKGKEKPDRFRERFGVASLARPKGQVLWIHGASVGESFSALPLVAELQKRLGDGWMVLMTTGTVSSADIMARRLPPGALHQFIPWDHPDWVDRFLDYWAPARVLWLESELWPNMLDSIQRRGIPAFLVNARMRPKTFARWRYGGSLARRMLGVFRLVLAGARSYVPYFMALGARDVRYIGNLKCAGDPLPVDAARLDTLRAQIGNRLCVGFLQAHPTEEVWAARLWAGLVEKHPDALVILVPRHPARAADMAARLGTVGRACALRSRGDAITPDTHIYIADTIGEMALWYSLCGLAVIGGSFITHGGQNPIEGTAFGTAVIYGPHMFNFPELCSMMEEAGAAIPVEDGTAMVRAAVRLINTPDVLNSMRDAARTMASANKNVIQSFADVVLGDV
jgi:3-deoxy-D-manno-octulosonic-acid transferase